MRTITGLLHVKNDVLRLGRCLETVYPCDQIVVVDHCSQDGTIQVAREYGACVVAAGSESLLQRKPDEWILCLDARESLSESLAASLYEWKSEMRLAANTRAFSIFLREETAAGWIENPIPQTRLVPHDWNRWSDWFPIAEPSAVSLEGELLRFVFP